MVRSVAWFKSNMPENVNAPFVAYLYTVEGLSPAEIKRHLEVYAVLYKIRSKKYEKAGDEKKKSESDRLFCVYKETKEYVEEDGREAVEAMVEKADSQLEQWCSEEGGFSAGSPLPEVTLPESAYDSADD